MKTTLILLMTLLLTVVGCIKDERNQNDLITENGIIYYYYDAGFGTSLCSFVIETETDKIYALEDKSNLSEFSGSETLFTQLELPIE